MTWKPVLVIAAIIFALLPLIAVGPEAAACYFLAVLCLGVAFFVP
jgi:hypothetical protein